MYAWIERDLVLNLARVVAVIDSPGAGDGAADQEAGAGRTAIHLANGRVLVTRVAKESVVRRIREAHL